MRLWFRTYSTHHTQIAGTDNAASTTNNTSQLASKLNSGFQGFQCSILDLQRQLLRLRALTHLNNFLVLLDVEHFSVHQLDTQPFFGHEVDPKHLSTNTIANSWKIDMSSGRRAYARKWLCPFQTQTWRWISQVISYCNWFRTTGLWRHVQQESIN